MTEETGLRPVDLIEEIKDNDQLKDELRVLLDKQPAYLPCCHFRQPMQKVEKSKKTLVASILMVWGTFLANMAFVFPYIYSGGWVPLLYSMFFASQVFFILTIKSQPGYMRGNSSIKFLKLVEKFDANMLCPACEVICTADSRHCYICNMCVDRFDHHC